MNTQPKRIALVCLGWLAAGAVLAQGVSKSDERMLAALAQANVNEVAAGQLAVGKASAPEVKRFAQQMVDDHTQGLQQVRQLAQSKQVTLPSEPDAQHKKIAEQLSALDGAAFDRAYLANAGVKDHQLAHKLVSDAQKNASDPDLKALAAKLAPVIDQHLQSVRPLAASHGATASGAAGTGGKTGGKTQ